MTGQFPHLTPGDKQISAGDMNNLSRSVQGLESIHGIASHSSLGVILRRQHQRKIMPPPVAAETVLIMGYQDVGQNTSAAFSCQRMDGDGNPTGEPFEVRARSGPNRMKEDLSKPTVPDQDIGDWLEIKQTRVKLPNGNVKTIMLAVPWFHGAKCVVTP